jgi:hypothetical protein
MSSGTYWRGGGVLLPSLHSTGRPTVARDYGRFGRPGPFQAQFEDIARHAGKSEIQHLSSLAGDGGCSINAERRMRTGLAFVERVLGFSLTLPGHDPPGPDVADHPPPDPDARPF